MCLAADKNQLLWALPVSMVMAFRLNSTLKDLTWGRKVMNTFCLVTNWSKSRIELKGIFQEVALEPVEWFVVFGDWGGGGWAALGVYQWCSHRLKAFSLLSFSTSAQYMGSKPAWYCLIVNIHVSASVVLQGVMFFFHWWELCWATEWCWCKKRKLSIPPPKNP